MSSYFIIPEIAPPFANNCRENIFACLINKYLNDLDEYLVSNPDLYDSVDRETIESIKQDD